MNMLQAYQTPYFGSAGRDTYDNAEGWHAQGAYLCTEWGSLGAPCSCPLFCIVCRRGRGPPIRRGWDSSFAGIPIQLKGGGALWGQFPRKCATSPHLKQVMGLPHQQLLEILSSEVRPSQRNVPSRPSPSPAHDSAAPVTL